MKYKLIERDRPILRASFPRKRESHIPTFSREAKREIPAYAGMTIREAYANGLKERDRPTVRASSPDLIGGTQITTKSEIPPSADGRG
jgi:hypothetical protein